MLIVLDDLRGTQVFQKKSNKPCVRRGIEQTALAWSATHGRQCARILSLRIEAGPFDRHRQQVIGGFAPTFGFGQGNFRGRVGGTGGAGTDELRSRKKAWLGRTGAGWQEKLEEHRARVSISTGRAAATSSRQ